MWGVYLEAVAWNVGAVHSDFNFYGVWRLLFLDLNFQPSGRQGVNFQLGICQFIWVVMATENMRKGFEPLGFLINPQYG